MTGIARGNRGIRGGKSSSPDAFSVAAAATRQAKSAFGFHLLTRRQAKLQAGVPLSAPRLARYYRNH
jgi:hypothetical protein